MGGALHARAGRRVGLDRVPSLDLRGGRVAPRRGEPVPLEEREGGGALEARDGGHVRVRAALADRDEQRPVLRDPVALGRVLRDDRAGRGRLGVGAVDDLHLRGLQRVLVRALRDLRPGRRDLPADDVGRADAGRVVARHGVHAPAREADRDGDPCHGGGETATVNGTVGPDPVDDRRRLAEHPGDERGGRPGALGRDAAGCCVRDRLGAEGTRGLARVSSELRLTLEQAVDELDGVVRRSRSGGGERRRGLVRPPEPGREAVLALEGHAAREQPEHDAAERVEIGRRAGHRAGGLLGRPVLGRSGEHAGDRRASGRPREPRETEIRDDDASGPALDEHVGRCQVAVDDSAPVRVRERRRDRAAVRPGLVPVERPPRDQRLEWDAFDELQDEHRLSLVLEHVVEADDVGMLEARERGRLALEPLA